MKTSLFFLTIFFLVSVCVSNELPPTILQANIPFQSENDFTKLMELGLDVIGVGDSYIEIYATQEEAAQIKNAGFALEVVHEDVIAFYQSRMVDKPMGNFKTLQEIYDMLDLYISIYPDLISPRVNIGTTYEGRDIWAVRISDNPTVDEDEPNILYTACIHAREVITPEILLNFIDHLLINYTTDPDIQEIIDETQLWLIPVVNPDGYAYNETTWPSGGGTWRKNRSMNSDGTRGVDLNRNYSFRWGYDNVGSSSLPSSFNYRGVAPFSEEETQAIRDLSLSYHFAASLYFHSKGELFMYPWGYTNNAADDNDIFQAFGDTVWNYNYYSPGAIYTCLYPVNGGACDWHYGEQSEKKKTIAFINEVGTSIDGHWPSAARIPVLVEENLETCLLIARNAGNFLKVFNPSSPQLQLSAEVSPESYSVIWEQYDPYNPAVSFELDEMSDYLTLTDTQSLMTNWISEGFSSISLEYVSEPYCYSSMTTPHNTNDYMKLKHFIDVSVGDTLELMVWYKTQEHFDYVYVEVALDDTNFVSIEGNITTTDNPNGLNRGHGMTGNSEGWVQGKFDLSAYAGQCIYLRLSYVTDDAIQNVGVYFDNIGRIGKANEVQTYVVSDTFYTFYDKPGGEDFYYRVRAVDAEGHTSNYSQTLKTTTIRSYFCGDANRDENINVGDAVFLITHIFKGGQAPNPIEAGDANCDGNVNVGDAVYIISHIFNGGPNPCCP